MRSEFFGDRIAAGEPIDAADIITSSQNSLIKMLRSLKRRATRDNLGLAFVEGPKLVLEAIEEAAKRRDEDFLRYLIVSSAFSRSNAIRTLQKSLYGRVRVAIISDSLYDSVSDTDAPQGVMAVFSQFGATVDDVLGGIDESNTSSAGDNAFASRTFRVLALDGVQDPGNVGVMTRSAAASGFTGLVLGAGTADFFSPKTLRATMGAAFRIPVAKNARLSEAVVLAKSRGAKVYAADSNGAANLYDACLGTGSLMIVIGGEGAGVSGEVLGLCDGALAIPMRNGVESLNAGAAASVIMYEAHRQYGGSK